MDVQLEKEEQEFLSLCSERDRSLFTGNTVMGLADYNRLIYLMITLEYFGCVIIMHRRFPELHVKSDEQSDRQGSILEEYPDYFEDEGVIDNIDIWMEEFLAHIPVESRTKRVREKLLHKLMYLDVG